MTAHLMADKLELLHFIIPLGVLLFVLIHRKNYNRTAKFSIYFIFGCAVISTFFRDLEGPIHHLIVIASMVAMVKNNSSTIDIS